MNLATGETSGKKHSICCVFSSWKISGALEKLTSAHAKILKIKINDVKRFLIWKQPHKLNDSLAKRTMAIRRMPEDADKLEAEPVVGAVGHTVEQKDDQESSSSSPPLPKKLYILSKSARQAASEIMEAFEDNDVKLIGLTGMGLVGKTTLVKLMGMKAIESDMFDAVIKVSCSSSEGFKPDSEVILLEITKSLDPKWNVGEVNTDGSKASELTGELVKKWKNILIILDDVWEVTDDLKTIGIPLVEDHKGCKILLTTRLLHVCQDFGCQKIIHLRETDGKLDHKPKLLFSGSVKLGSFPFSTYYRGSNIEEQMLLTSKSLKRNYDYLNDTKKQSFFLLCSHFPRKYAPTVEELTRYGIGQGLFIDYETIESARKEAHSIVSSLQSNLIVEEEGYYIRMCDPFHILALWIENLAESLQTIWQFFSNKFSENGKINFFTFSTTIFLQTSQFPSYEFFDLTFTKLQTLTIIEDDYGVNFYRDRRFGSGPHMTKLNVLCLQAGSFPSGDWVLNPPTLSLEGIENLQDLQTLQVKGYKVKGLSSLVKLNKLEILGFLGCTFEDKLPEGLGELHNLKMLDFSYCVELHEQPQEWVLKLFKLKELYITDVSLELWSRSCFLQYLQDRNPWLSLAVLSPKVSSAFCPQQFVVPKFASYRIELNLSKNKEGEGEGEGEEEEEEGEEGEEEEEEEEEVDQFVHFKPISLSKCLRIKALPLSPFVELFKDVEYLHLSDIKDCRNIVPSLDKGGLSGLQDLQLHGCEGLEYLIDEEGIGGDFVQICAFSKLTNLELVDLPYLKSLWNGGGHMINLGSLKNFLLRGCEDLEGYIFSKSITQSLQQLEILEVSKCSNLKAVFEQCFDDGPICLSKLVIVKIYDAEELLNVFPSYVTEGLPQLRELQVNECWSLKHVFISSNNEVDEKNDLDHCCHLELPQLRVLVLGYLYNLKNFCQGKDFIVAPLLEDLQVDYCEKLEPFTLTLNNGMCPRLKKLCLVWESDAGSSVSKTDVVKGYAKMSKWSTRWPHFIIRKRPFDSFGIYFLSNLKELKLQTRNLQVLWKDSTINGLQNLTHLSLDGCSSLEYVFTPLSVHNVPNLKCLRIEGCHELGQIVAEDETTTEAHRQQHHPIWFPNLSDIYISYCRNLSNVFPVRFADQLPRLKRLQVERMTSLTQIFGPEKDNYETSNSKVVQIPLLQNLILEDLRYMARFAPEGFHFTFPALDHLELRNCTKMQTSFYAAKFQRGVCAITEGGEIRRSTVEYTQPTNAAVAMPIFSGDNYKPWRDKMMTYFKSQDLWEVVKQGIKVKAPLKETPDQKKKDAQALFVIQNAVLDPIYSNISGATSARDAWLTLENLYATVDDPHIRKLFPGNEQEAEKWSTAERLQMDGDNNILWPDGRSASEHERREITVDLRDPDGLSALDLI